MRVNGRGVMKQIRIGVIGAGGMSVCRIPGFRQGGAEAVVPVRSIDAVCASAKRGCSVKL